MLKREELLKLFETAGAIRHGHFELSSGLHSGTYVQCALVLQYPRFAEKLGQALAALFSDSKIEAVVSPAMGGLIIGQEATRVVEEAGARVVAAGALIDRSGGKIDFEVEAQSLIQLPIASYEEEDCPLCRGGSVAVKPGSRFVRSAL